MIQTHTFRHFYAPNTQIFNTHLHALRLPPISNNGSLPNSKLKPFKTNTKKCSKQPKKTHTQLIPLLLLRHSISSQLRRPFRLRHTLRVKAKRNPELRVDNSEGQTISFNRAPITLATLDNLFHNGKLIPSEPLTQPSPLKLPPRLQNIKNIRRSLRGALGFNHKSSASEFKISRGFDPFTATMETVRKEDVRWCQITKQQHAKSLKHVWLYMNEIGNANIAFVGKDEGRGEEEPMVLGRRSRRGLGF